MPKESSHGQIRELADYSRRIEPGKINYFNNVNEGSRSIDVSEHGFFPRHCGPMGNPANLFQLFIHSFSVAASTHDPVGFVINSIIKLTLSMAQHIGS